MKTFSLSSFGRAEKGSGAVEFALVALVFVAIMVGIIDMGRLAYELNSDKAATRAGARFAVVNDMVSNTYTNYDPLANGYVPGQQVPTNAVGVDTCTSTSCTLGGRNAAAFTAIVTEVRRYNDRVQAANVQVRYEHVGIGVAGNPYAPDVEPLVTVRLTGLTFAPGALQIFGVAPISLPSMATTLSGEDLN